MIAFEHDVVEFERVPQLFERVVRELGGLDLFVYASGIMLDVEGCDVSPVAVAHARTAAATAKADVRFSVHDVLHDELPRGYDVITCSLFLHHLDNDSACDLLRRLGGAGSELILVNDLSRGLAGFLALLNAIFHNIVNTLQTNKGAALFGFDVLVCDRCAGPRRILGAVTEPHAVRRFLAALGLACPSSILCPLRKLLIQRVVLRQPRVRARLGAVRDPRALASRLSVRINMSPSLDAPVIVSWGNLST